MSNANSSFQLLASVLRSVNTTQLPQTPNHSWRGMMIVVDVTVRGGTHTITPGIRVKDENGDFNGVLWDAAAAIAATGEFVYVLYPGASGGNATEVDGVPVPLEWQYSDTHGGTADMTYSIRIHYIQ